MSVPNAVFILYFFANSKVLSVPAKTSYAFSLQRAGRKGVRQLVGKGLGAQPDALVGHQLGGLLVHQVAVLDALHARSDCPLDRSGRVGMHRDVGPPVLGGLDGGAQLGLGEGGCVERAVRRGHAAPGRQLDLCCAQHELLARAQPHLVRTVRDHGGTDLLPAGLGTTDGARQLERLPEVAMTTGDGDYGAGRVDAWAGDDPLVDRPLESECRPAQIANGREPAHERVRGLRACYQIQVADVRGEQNGHARPHQHRVPVHVDQPGHQRAAAAGNCPGAGAGIDRNRILRDLLDRVPRISTFLLALNDSLLPSKIRTFSKRMSDAPTDWG